MTSTQAKLDRYLIFNSLSCVVKALEGKYTTIDLRDESYITGKIENVDGFMNVELTDVILYDPRGNPHSFEEFYLNKRNIRYVHIPKELSAAELTQNVFDKMVMPKAKPSKKKTFKMKRAQAYHQETVRSLQNENQS